MFRNRHGGLRDDFCAHICFHTQAGLALHESQWAADILGNHCPVTQNGKKNESEKMCCWVLPCSSLRTVCTCEAPKVKIAANAIDFSFLPLNFLFPALLGGMASACGHPYPTALSQDASQHLCWGEDKGFLWKSGATQPLGLITTSGIVSVLRDEQGCSCKRSAHGLQRQKSQSKTAESWLDKCWKRLETNTPRRRSQPFRNQFKAMGD